LRREALRRDELAFRRDPFVWPVEVPAPVMLARVEARARQLRRRRRVVMAASPVPFLLIAFLIGALTPGLTTSNVRTVDPAGESRDNGFSPTTTTVAPTAAGVAPDGGQPLNDVTAAAVNATGTAPVQTDNVAHHSPPEDAPRPSATTGRIAFIRAERIWVINADGTDEHPVTPPGERWRTSHWAADGRLLAEQLLDVSGPRLAVLDIDAGTRTYFDGGPFTDARFSPDGALIAYVAMPPDHSVGDNYAVWVMRADGTGRRMVTANGNSPYWSGDGRSLMFQSGRGTEIVDLDGSNRRLLSEVYYLPNASPDGTRLAAMRADGTGHWALDSLTPGLADAKPVVPDHNMRAEWSPDGSWIAVERVTRVGGCTVQVVTVCESMMTNVWLVRSDGTALQPLTIGSHDADLTFGPPAKRR